MNIINADTIIINAKSADLVELNDFAVNPLRAFADARGLSASALVGSWTSLFADNSKTSDFRGFLRAKRPAASPSVPRRIRAAIWAICKTHSLLWLPRRRALLAEERNHLNHYLK